MAKIIECVPNFSEGRDRGRIRSLVAAAAGVSGAWVLDVHSDPDHNRTVITLAGEPEAVAEAALRAAGAAARIINLNQHRGAHPRIGAIDVLPFVPAENATMQDCIAIAHQTGRRIWERFRIPVYFYQAAALCPERAALEAIRRGQFEALRTEALANPARAPDLGGPGLHPTAGAVAVGARNFLIAFNIALDTQDVSVARDIARAIRASAGGLPGVKALGIALPSRGISQVTMNLTDIGRTSLEQAYEAVEKQARRHGCAIAGTEIVGLVPQHAVERISGRFRRLLNLGSDQIFEYRLIAARGGDQKPPAATGACAKAQ